MPIFHATLYFSWQRDYSWVEQFYIDQDQRGFALTLALDLAQARFLILGAGATIYRVRVCQYGLRFGCISSGVQGKPRVQPAAAPIAGLEVRLTAAKSNRHWRNYCMRGLPAEAFVKVGSQWRLSDAWRPLVQAWLAKLVTDGWLLRVEEALGAPMPIGGLNPCALVERDIYGDPLDPETTPPSGSLLAAVFTTSPPQGGSLVHISGVRPTPNTAALRQRLNGTHDLALTSSNAVFWLGSYERIESTQGGTAEVRKISFMPMGQYSIKRRVARKCGPFVEAGEIPAPEPMPPNWQHPPITIPPLPKVPIAGAVVVKNFYFTLQDVFKEVFAGYNPVVTPSDPLLGLAQVAKAGRPAYAVFLAGVDWTVENRTTMSQFLDAAQAFVGLPDQYTEFLREIIRLNTPDDCELYCFGHSFGGMALQWLDTLIPFIGGRRVTKLVACGTAWIVTDYLGPLIKRLFYVRGDFVTFFSPGGNIFIPRVIINYLSRFQEVALSGVAMHTVGIAGQTLLDGPDLPIIDFIGRHNCYATLPACLERNWDGSRLNEGQIPPLQTGTVQRYQYPV